MTGVLWLDPSFGASGDMLLGTLVGLGAPLADIVHALDALEVDGWSMAESTTIRCGLVATRVAVTTDDHDHDHDHDHPHDHSHGDHDHTRRWTNIDRLIADADLSARVRDGARRTFRRLGEVEAAAHGVSIDEVLFHEVGAVDAIVDIVGVWIGADLLEIDSIVVGPVGIGHGTVTGSHGILPLPAPATAALLRGAPVRSLDVASETCTPTGAALLATLGTWGRMPDGVLVRSARGAGGRDPEAYPNVVTGHLLQPEATPDRSTDVAPRAEAAVVLETNLDDVTPEVIGHVIDRLLDAGANDAWTTTILMKKGRQAQQLSVLTDLVSAASLRDLISRETGTLGIRQFIVEKYPLPRSVDVVELLGHEVRIKVGPHGAKPEHDDLVAVAAATGQPLRALAMQALAVWRDILHS